MTYLGIDLGPSGLPALLAGEDGTPIAASECSCGIPNPPAGWAEQDPADWIRAINSAVDELRSKYPRYKKLKGIRVARHTGASLQSIIVTPNICETIDLEPALSDSFEDAYHAFRAAYPAIKSIQ